MVGYGSYLDLNVHVKETAFACWILLLLLLLLLLLSVYTLYIIMCVCACVVYLLPQIALISCDSKVDRWSKLLTTTTFRSYGQLAMLFNSYVLIRALMPRATIIVGGPVVVMRRNKSASTCTCCLFSVISTVIISADEVVQVL